MRLFLFSLFALPVLTAAQSAGPSETPVKFKSGKEAVRALHMPPPGPGPFPAVVVLHGDFGLTDWVKKQARRVAAKGYVVLAVDLYDGELPKTIEEAHILERGLVQDKVLADVKSAVDYLGSLPDVRKESIGVLGWDCGGGYALDAAINDRRLKTAILCYGRVTTDAKLLAPLQGNVLAIFGGKDPGIPPLTIDQFRKAMQKAGKPVAIHVYPECGNSFMDPESPFFDGPPNRAAITDAWTKIEGNLEKALKK